MKLKKVLLKKKGIEESWYSRLWDKTTKSLQKKNADTNLMPFEM
jgi:hypothetical protein